MLEAVLRGYESRVGNDHPDTLDCRRYLADCYRDAGRIADAIALHERTLKQLESKLAQDHPYTIACRSGLAEDYAAAGRLVEAVPLFEASLKLRQAKLGAEHPNSLISMNELAGAYLRCQEVGQRRKIGPRMPDRPPKKPSERVVAVLHRNQLGAASAGQRKFAEAEPHLIQGYQGLKEREPTMPAQGKRELESSKSANRSLLRSLGQKGQSRRVEDTTGPAAIGLGQGGPTCLLSQSFDQIIDPKAKSRPIFRREQRIVVALAQLEMPIRSATNFRAARAVLARRNAA